MQETADSLNTQAIMLAAQGDYSDAIACLKKALTIDNRNHLLWFNLGITYRDAGKLRQAKAMLEKALTCKDDDIDTIETLAIICNSLDEESNALNYCYEGLDINQKNPHLWNTTGVILFNHANYKEACKAFEQAVSLNPFYYDALYNLRDTYDELHNEQGKQSCIEALKRLPAGK
ncbi:MAG: tetratricopeptide repeat protein [Treponema sp.]|nr:tetratricopeptide repeat protein [Treponema sp.]